MTYKAYGKKSIKEMKSLPVLKLDYTINGGNVKELFKKEKGKNFMGFQDYLGRKFTLNEPNFLEHIKEKYLTDEEQRDKIFPHIGSILNDPDEVYFTKYKKKEGKASFQTNYIKFFEDVAIVVNTLTGSDLVEIKTWFKLKAAEDVIRRGYLIYSKKN